MVRRVATAGVVVFVAALFFVYVASNRPRFSFGAAPMPTAAELVGFDRLSAKLKEKTPTGKGVTIGHIEGPTGDYMPNINSPQLKGVNFRGASGPSKSNEHSDATSKFLVGAAPGVEHVVCYSSDHWLGEGGLHLRSSRAASGNGIRVYTNSWIAPEFPDAAAALARLDDMIDRQDTIFVVGVNNNRTSPVPPILASAYNVISVGSWEGNSSGGYTRVEGVGRCKPELVGPTNLTSFATPIVAGCVARLLEVTDGMADAPAAHKPQVIKAILMAGAEKPGGWKTEEGKPLDEHFGAGCVRMDTSYDILTAGQAKPGALKSRYGWSFESIKNGETQAYTFQSSQALGEASLVLTWHRRIIARPVKNEAPASIAVPVWVFASRFANLDLKLIHIDDAGAESVAGQSTTRIDNVEHVYLKGLERGRYRIEVSRKDTFDEPWDYGLAWRVETPAVEAPKTP